MKNYAGSHVIRPQWRKIYRDLGHIARMWSLRIICLAQKVETNIKTFEASVFSNKTNVKRSL